MVKPFENLDQATGLIYPQYFLQYNPFHVSNALREKEDAGDARALFLRHVYQKEINKVMACIGDLVGQTGMPRLWILKDNSAAAEHNISVIGGVFRSILRSESPRLFPAYIPLPMLAENALKEITRLLIDRFQEPIFRRCVYTFIFHELQELLKSNRASEILPKFDIESLLEKIDETEGEILQEILFPKKEEEEQEVESQKLEEQTEAKGQKLEEEQPGARNQEPGGEEESRAEGEELKEESEEKGEESKEKQEEKEQAERLANFITEAAKQKQFGEQIERSIDASVHFGFDKGHSNLSQYMKYRELIPGLLRLLLYSYNKIVILVDQLEFWPMFEDTHKAEFIGALSEFEWLAQDKAILIFSSYPETVEDIGQAYAASFRKQSLDLKLSNLDIIAPFTTEQTIDVLNEFLNSDPYRNQKQEHLKTKKLGDLYPFTQESVKVMVEHESGDIAGVLELCERLLDEGKSAGYPIIDQEFVEKILI